MTYAIEIVNLSKEFTPAKNLFNLYFHPFRREKAILAVDNINLQIKQGELFALVGPNGAGKTTLIKMLCCLILPSKGTARVAGYDILRDEEKVKSSVGIVTGDERSFYWRLTGRQNLQFFATLYGLSSKQANNKINELCTILEIKDQLDRRFQEYSAGIKQRLSIARSLLNDPSVLFIDEPTKSLDPLTRQNLAKFIKEKLVGEQKKTVFFVTHLLNEAENFSEYLAIIDKGKIKACGRLDMLKSSLGIPNATIEDIFSYYTSK